MVKRAYRRNPIGTTLILLGLAGLGVYVVTRKKGVPASGGGGGGTLSPAGQTAANVGGQLISGGSQGTVQAVDPAAAALAAMAADCASRGGGWAWNGIACVPLIPGTNGYGRW